MIKIYKTEYGDKYCKINITIDIPIEDLENITSDDVVKFINNMDSSKIVDEFFSKLDTAKMIMESDNIPPTPSIEYVEPDIVKLTPIEIQKQQEELISIFLLVIKSALKDGRKYVEIFTNIIFNEENLKIIHESGNIKLQYDYEKLKYDIFIEY